MQLAESLQNIAADMQFAESFLREQCRRIRWLAKKRSKLHICCGTERCGTEQRGTMRYGTKRYGSERYRE